MSSIMEQFKPEHPELLALEFGKIAETDFVYTLASRNINQSAPNLVKMYMTIRTHMSLIMDLIGAELCELFALEFAMYTLASINVDKGVPQYGHNIFGNEILDEFSYGSNPTITSGVICP